MFTKARSDLRELIELTEKISSYDATLAAKPDVEPARSAVSKRLAWETRKIELMDKYELL